MQKTCDVAEKAILAQKKLRKKCVPLLNRQDTFQIIQKFFRSPGHFPYHQDTDYPDTFEITWTHFLDYPDTF